MSDPTDVVKLNLGQPNLSLVRLKKSSTLISNACKKINNQFNVMLRFRKLTRREILFKLYKAKRIFYLIFYYCFSVWHFCGARDEDKLEALNKRILRFILGDYSSPHTTLLFKGNSTSLCNNRVQNFLILLYKSLFFTQYIYCLYEEYVFTPVSPYDLRGNYILSLSKLKTTTYGLNSFSYFSAKQWNALPDFFRTTFFSDFKTKIQDVTFM